MAKKNEMAEITVKPLVWKDKSGPYKESEAKTPFHNYNVIEVHKGKAFWTYGEASAEPVDSLEAAKEAAQAHWEKFALEVYQAIYR